MKDLYTYLRLYGLYSMEDLGTAAAMYRYPASFLSLMSFMNSSGSFKPFAIISWIDSFFSLPAPLTNLEPFLCPKLESGGFWEGGVGDNRFFFPAALSINSCFSLNSLGRSGKGDPLSSSGSTDDFRFNALLNGSVSSCLVVLGRAGRSFCFL